MSSTYKNASAVTETQKTRVAGGEHVPYVDNYTMEDSSYRVAFTIVPVTVTTGSNYFIIRNPDATKKVKIVSIEMVLNFTGTAGASRSNYIIKKFTGATATNGNVMTATPSVTSNPASIASCQYSTGTITLTGATIPTYGFVAVGHANQLTANIVYDRDLNDAPLVLGQNEGIVLQSDGALLAGSAVSIAVKWIEEQ